MIEFDNIAFLIAGVLVGWITKIPLFLKYYREWQVERDQIRRFMKRMEAGE